MLGLVLIYFVGKAFYDLAVEHGKSKWGFAVLGVLSYYVGLFLGSFIIALVYELGLSQSIEEVNEMVVSVMSIPVGVLCCWGFYKILQSSWKKPKTPFASEEILDAGLTGGETQH